MDDISISIDVGTSRTIVAWSRPGSEINFLKWGESAHVPTAFHLSSNLDSKIQVGEEALKATNLDEHGFIDNLKTVTLEGKSVPLTHLGRTETASQLLTALFQTVREQLEVNIPEIKGKNINNVILTEPGIAVGKVSSEWHDSLSIAAKAVGFTEPRSMPETESLVRYWLSEKQTDATAFLSITCCSGYINMSVFECIEKQIIASDAVGSLLITTSEASRSGITEKCFTYIDEVINKYKKIEVLLRSDDSFDNLFEELQRDKLNVSIKEVSSPLLAIASGALSRSKKRKNVDNKGSNKMKNELLSLASEINQLVKGSEDIARFSTERNKLLELTGEGLRQKFDNAVSIDGTLRIGIVGQVKAGKSSFVNSLLFGGKDILPKSSTPMTAALTVIRYGDQVSAEVEYYSKEDWERIENGAELYKETLRKVAEEYDIAKSNEGILSIFKKARVNDEIDIIDEVRKEVGDAIEGAYELSELAKKSKINLKDYLGKTEKILGSAASISSLVGRLNDYVGANGKYTPITKSTILHLNIPSLKGIEIIDTPGVNDPIISRTITTREFLSKCDTVFMLSTSSQFMGTEDTEFLTNTLPCEGISSIKLLGSKFDSVLVDEYKKYDGDIMAAIKDVTRKLAGQARQSINTIASSYPDKPLMEDLKNNEVKFISSVCYNAARNGKKSLDNDESHSLAQIERRYKVDLTEKNLYALANIDAIRDKDLKEIKENKSSILSTRLSSISVGQSGLILTELHKLERELSSRLNELSYVNIEEKRAEQENIKTALSNAEEDIKQIFVDLHQDIKLKTRKLLSLIRSEQQKFFNINVDRKSEEVLDYVEDVAPTKTWYNPFVWGKSKKVEHHKTQHYNTAKTSDAAEQTTKFIQYINEKVEYAWDSMIDKEKLEEDLKKSAFKAFDIESKSYNKGMLINPLKNALTEIVIESHIVNKIKYRNMIIGGFSSTVRDGEVNKLQENLIDITTKIIYDLEKDLKSKNKEVERTLENKGGNFIAIIGRHVDKDYETLKKELQDVEGSKKRYANIISTISEHASTLGVFTKGEA